MRIFDTLIASFPCAFQYPPSFHVFLVTALFASGTVAAFGGELTQSAKDQAHAFFQHNCFDCHDAETAKAGLNLEKADPAMTGPAQIDLWTKIYDRVAKGEMPPAKKPRPAPAEIQCFLPSVRPPLIEADRARRQVVQRRLNRQEYQNTIWDLLAIDIEFEGPASRRPTSRRV